MTGEWKYQRLDFERPEGRMPLWANLFRFGGEGTPAPLVMYLRGGPSKDKTKYLGDRAFDSSHIAAEFAKAAKAAGGPRVDFLVCPSPFDSLSEETGKAEGVLWWESHFDDRIVPALGGFPSAVALVGHSAGGPTALYLAVFLGARALATLSGAGLRKFLNEADPKASFETKALYKLLRAQAKDGWEGCEYRIYCNAEDPYCDAPEVVAPLVPRLIQAVPMIRRPGGHDFDPHYVGNGDGARALRFLIDAVTA